MEVNKKIFPAFFFLAMFGQTLCATLIGDFAPLQVGNTWKYLITNSSFNAPSQTGTVTRTVKSITVTSKTMSGNNTIYFIAERDTGSITTRIDSVIESSSGVLSPIRLGTYTLFYKHQVVDTIAKGSTSFGGSNYTTFNATLGDYTHTYAQNIGLYYSFYSYHLLGGNDYTTTVSLIEFNGTPAVVSISKGNNYLLEPAMVQNILPGTRILGATRNILGRFLAPKSCSLYK